MSTRTEKAVKALRLFVSNLKWAQETEFNRGRLEAYEDALQMLTGERE